MNRDRYDVVIVGGGHNALTAAAYLGRAGRSVLLLERLDHVGGAAVSARPFAGVDVELSRYSYLVSLMPRQIIDELGLAITLRRRRFGSYTPVGDVGLLDDGVDPAATARSFARVTGGGGDHLAWASFRARIARAAERIFPTMTQPLVSEGDLRELVDDDATWELLVRRPLGETLRETFVDDVVRGVVGTDALIGTFVDLDDSDLRQNRCFLYHVVGNGTGDWDVPVGGMGAVTAALQNAALSAGVDILVGASATGIDPAGEVQFEDAHGRARQVGAGYVLAGCAPATLAGLLGEEPEEAPEGAQLKVNMVLRRLPKLRDGVDPVAAFSGTFHVNESMAQLQAAYRQAAAGRIPELPPAEIYCHSLTDPSILGAQAQADGLHTLTLFGLHMPARLFRSEPETTRAAALEATLRSLNSVLAEPIEDCLHLDAEGRPCLETRTPVDLQTELDLPGGHIFHRDLSWPFAESSETVGTWGVETEHPRVLLCGAGARRGGGVSGIPGRAAAMALLDRP